MRTLCSFDGCTKPNCAGGLCNTHYAQKRRGHELRPIQSGWTPERFWSKVKKTDGCWEWTGHINSVGGYGRDFIHRRAVSAHRLSFELTKGPIPDGLVVMHSCDNRKCVRPDHLSLGTVADNQADMVSKNRQCKGIDQPDAKLTEDDVVAIRMAISSGAATKRDLARELGVSQALIYNVVTRRNWKHVA